MVCLPLESLERIVYYASLDHRLLAVLMQVNSTFLRIAAPYLYREPFDFTLGDEFLQDWDTTNWTQYLRQVRHSQLLMLYLCCTGTVQAQMCATFSSSSTSSFPDDSKSHRATATRRRCCFRRFKDGSSSSTSLELTKVEWRQDRSLLRKIPPLLHTILAAYLSTFERLPQSETGALKGRHLDAPKASQGPASVSLSINYLEQVLHLDLVSFLSSSLRSLLSLPLPSLLSSQEPARPLTLREYQAERIFVEHALFQSTARHITTLSVSVATFVRLQSTMMEHIGEPKESIPATKNRAGNLSGSPLSQLRQLNIFGVHAEIKIKILNALRWFMRRHVATYPGVLIGIAMEGAGDSLVNRSRRRERNGHLPPQPPTQQSQGTGRQVFEPAEGFNNRQNSHLVLDLSDVHEGELSNVGSPFATTQASRVVEADLVHFLEPLLELQDQLESLDLSKWSWSIFNKEAIDTIPTSRLRTLVFHPRTEIQGCPGHRLLKRCRFLENLAIHAYDPAMLKGHHKVVDDATMYGSSRSDLLGGMAAVPYKEPKAKYCSPLRSLVLSGDVLKVVAVAQDAMARLYSTLTRIDLTAHVEGFISNQDSKRLMDWTTTLSNLQNLTSLRLGGHLALTFEAPFLFEACPSIREFTLSILSYSSYSLFTGELARVVPKFMAPLGGEEQTYGLNTLVLEGHWMLTDQDMDEMALRLKGLVHLNLVGCRFLSESGSSRDTIALSQLEEQNLVARLTHRLEGSLRTLTIHRRGLESSPCVVAIPLGHEDVIKVSPLKLNIVSGIDNKPSLKADCVLKFKQRFPLVKVTIVEKQRENSFVVAPPIQHQQHPSSNRNRRSSHRLGSGYHLGRNPPLGQVLLHSSFMGHPRSSSSPTSSASSPSLLQSILPLSKRLSGSRDRSFRRRSWSVSCRSLSLPGLSARLLEKFRRGDWST